MLDGIRSKIEVDQSWDRSSDFRLKTTILLVER